MSEQDHPLMQQRGPGKFVRFALVGLLVALLIGLTISNVQQAAWSQGYAMGLMAGDGEGDTLSQYLLYNNGIRRGAGPGFGGVFAIGLLIFGGLALAKIGRMWMWRMHGGPGAEAWQRHWHHGPYRRRDETTAHDEATTAASAEQPETGVAPTEGDRPTAV